MNLISFKNTIKLVKSQAKVHKNVLISNKNQWLLSLRPHFRPVAICDLPPQRQWNWVPVAQHLQKAYKFEAIPYKFEAIP